ncbi:MAG TPA: helix-hairpin-helix domain-containing protein, partial [Quisquiliibacterium sp.]|nr:helix-hairpin-helix domain-containing protein [Quisquiliibacterium sp.]
MRPRMKAAALLSLLLSAFSAGVGAGAATDANTADQAALERVAGIGPAIAARIVASRR